MAMAMAMAMAMTTSSSDGTSSGRLKSAPHHKGPFPFTLTLEGGEKEMEMEEELWNRFNKRPRSPLDLDSSSNHTNNNDEKKKKKKKKKKEENMKVLKEGLEVVASSLTQLAHNTLGACGVDVDGETLSLSLSDHVIQPQPQPQPQQTSTLNPNLKESVENAPQLHSKGGGKLKHHRNVAEAMAGKAKFLERQLQSLKADLSFVRERCVFLEEENARLRGGDGVRPEEDDLVRLQLEALLAEKGRLAQENANYARENEYLHQLVEYHQLTLTLHEDMAAAIMPPLPAMCLEFSPASASASASSSASASPPPLPLPLPPMKRKTENEEHHIDYEHGIAA